MEDFDATTTGPFEVRVALAPTMDPSRVRAGLFPADQAEAELELEDGTIVPGLADIDILVSKSGTTKLDDTWSDTLADLEVVAVRITPLMPASLSGSTVVVGLPESNDDPDAYYRLIVWYDADQDGKLQLSESGPSEFSRAPGRRFPDSADLYLFSVSADAQSGEWNATAVRRIPQEEETYEQQSVSDRELGDWNIDISAPTQP